MLVNHNSQMRAQTLTFSPGQTEAQIQNLKSCIASLEKTFKLMELSLTERHDLLTRDEELLTQAQEHQLKLQNFQKQVKQAHEDKQAKHQYLQRKIHEFEILTQKEILTREIYHEFLLNVFRPQIDFYFLKKEIKIKKLEENILHLRQSLLSSTTKEMKNIIKKAELAAGEFEQNTFMLIEALESDLSQSRTTFLKHLFYSPQLDLKFS